MPTLLDHVFVCLFAVAYPVYGWFSYQKLQRQVAAGEDINRVNMYRWTIIEQWSLAAIGVFLWINQQRDWSTLGFGLTMDWMFWLALLIGVVLVAYYAYASRRVDSMPDGERAKLIDTIRQLNLQALVPTTRRELHWLYRLSVTAGIVEELLWRGFLWWYLSIWLPQWSAALIVITVFGLAHIYQGLSGVLRTAILGGVFLLLFWLSGSLWLSIVVHALADILQGRMLFKVVEREADHSPVSQDQAVA